MLLHCDLVYAATESRFQFPFVPLGIVPEFASTFLLPLTAGYQRAAGMLLHGRPFDAEEAHRAGIVTSVVPRADLLAEAEKAADLLAQQPVEALRITKRLMKARHKATVIETIAEENSAIHDCLRAIGTRERLGVLLRKGAAGR
jgi:enoyl-CoA hydratase/carnithine racemase